MAMIKQYSDFQKVVIRQFSASDFDAEHPVWLYLIKRFNIPTRDAIWLSILYMAYYDEASAWVTFQKSDPFKLPKNIKYPIGKNRRNLYGNGITKHFLSIETLAQQSKHWPVHNLTGDAVADWAILRNNLAAVWGNGRFGVYTTAEMLQKVNGVDVVINTFDNKNSSGPADGIKRLYGCPADLKSLDLHAEKAFQLVREKMSVKPTYTAVDRGVVESVLCNYSGVCRGKFYCGRNLDRQQDRILAVESLTKKELTPLWDARGSVFNKSYLGEFNGWVGVDKPRLKHYLNTGVVLWPNEER